MPTIVVCFGTRPEVIKLAPVIAALRARAPARRVVALSTGQQASLLPQSLAAFALQPDVMLPWPARSMGLAESLAFVVTETGARLREIARGPLVVQGDTLSALGAGLAGFYDGRPVVHVEAGLRTYELAAPFPEEMHRQALSRLATLHLAPTEEARARLLAEGVDERAVQVTGNTGQDALRIILPSARRPLVPGLPEGAPYVVATLHRRENAAHAEAIARGLADGAARGGLAVVVVRHPNPALSAPLEQALGARTGVHFLPPLPMAEMVGLCREARFLVTDSGGLQEEAVALGLPCLVLRRRTDRPESVACGTALVLGVDEEGVREGVSRLARDEGLRRRMAVAAGVYGDGHAAQRCAEAILALGAGAP